MISAVDLLGGIARLAGMEVIRVPGATGFIDTDYKAKARYAVDALDRLDFVYMHVEAPDEAGHMGSVEEKVRAIERLDEAIGIILERPETVCASRITHTDTLQDAPLPGTLLLCSEGKDSVKGFSGGRHGRSFGLMGVSSDALSRRKPLSAWAGNL